MGRAAFLYRERMLNIAEDWCIPEPRDFNEIARASQAQETASVFNIKGPGLGRESVSQAGA